MNTDNSELNDARTPQFIWIDNVVFTDFNLTPHEFVVYVALCYHANRKTGNKCWPALSTIAKESNMSRRTVIRAIDALENRNLIQVTRRTDPENPERNISNLYTIMDANKVMINSHHPSVTESPPLVSQSHHPSVTESPKQESINKNHSIADKSAVDIKPTKSNSKKQTAIPAARMNPMKDAIAAAFGIDWQAATKNEIGMIQKAAKELCEAGRVPENIATIYRYCEKQFSSAFTPVALTKHATAAMNEHEAQTTRHAKAQQETVEEVPPEVRQANAAAMRETLNKMRQEASA